jgi:hypothetical protein
VAADMDETWRLWATIEAWWPAVEVLIEHRVSNRVWDRSLPWLKSRS